MIVRNVRAVVVSRDVMYCTALGPIVKYCMYGIPTHVRMQCMKAMYASTSVMDGNVTECDVMWYGVSYFDACMVARMRCMRVCMHAFNA